MNLQNQFNPLVNTGAFHTQEFGHTRRFDRHEIKRRVLIKDPAGNIQTAHAFDISHQGIQVRCSPHIAYQLKSMSDLEQRQVNRYELKIALPYMNQLVSCGIQCRLTSFERFDRDSVRLGFEFLDFESGTFARLSHFIDNLSA